MNKYIVLIISALFIGCSATKKIKPMPMATTATSYKKLLSGYAQGHTDFQSLKSDIKLTAQLDGSSYKATGHIRHVRGEGIFISVKKLGLELGQVLLTPDSVYVLNRWEKEYIKEPISVIKTEYEINGDFNLVEELLTDIPHVDTYKKSTKSTIESGRHKVEVKSAHPGIDLILWLQGNENQVAQAYYEDYAKRGIRMKYQERTQKKLVIEREIHTENIEDGEVHIKLIYKNPQFDNTQLPSFKIPSHYKRKRM